MISESGIFHWLRFPAGIRVGADAHGRPLLIPKGAGRAEQYEVSRPKEILDDFIALADGAETPVGERAERYALCASEHGFMGATDEERVEQWDARINTLAFFSNLSQAVKDRSRTDVLDTFKWKVPSSSPIRFYLTDPAADPRTPNLDEKECLRRAENLLDVTFSVEANDNIRLSLYGCEVVNLLGVVWLQMRQSLSRGQPARICLQCRLPFWPDAFSRGNRVRYCSNRCRQANHRRRSRARKLHANGQSSRSIAKEMAIPEKRVREWLKTTSQAARPQPIQGHGSRSVTGGEDDQ
jgi:hypothetical protein